MRGEVIVPPSKKLEDLIHLTELCVDLLQQNEEHYAEVSDLNSFLSNNKQLNSILILRRRYWNLVYIYWRYQNRIRNNYRIWFDRIEIFWNSILPKLKTQILSFSVFNPVFCLKSNFYHLVSICYNVWGKQSMKKINDNVKQWRLYKMKMKWKFKCTHSSMKLMSMMNNTNSRAQCTLYISLLCNIFAAKKKCS